jgi:hypothetical protein
MDLKIFRREHRIPRRRLGDCGGEGVLLGLEPRLCLPGIGEWFGSDAGGERGQVDRFVIWMQQERAVNGGVQVVVDQPADGGPALALTVMGAGLLGGVGAEQLVDGVPAGEVLAQYVGAAEFAEHLAARGLVQAGHAGSRVRGDVCAWMQASSRNICAAPALNCW